MNRIMNKRTKKDTKSFKSKNKKFKEKLFLPIKESEDKDFYTKDSKDKIKLECKNIFDENYLIDFRTNMKTKFKLTKPLTFYKKADKYKNNINQRAITSKKNKTISKNRSNKKGKSFNKNIINNKIINNNINNENENNNENNNKNNEDNNTKIGNSQIIKNNGTKNNNSDNNTKIINISNNTKDTSKNNDSNNKNKNKIIKKSKDDISNNNIKIINSNNDNNNPRKSNIKKRKNVLSPKINEGIKISESSQTKSKDKNNELGKTNKLNNIISKNKETMSTNVDTLSIEKDKTEENKEEENYNDIIKAHFTPIPSLLRRTSKIIRGIIPNVKDVEKAINLRRQQYNEYLKALNKPKPKPKPKPKVYDLDDVIFIQKMYKGYQVKGVNQTVTRLKINLCVTELLCLILNNVYKHARKRITFYMFKTYYHDPFTHIFTEVNFTDKIAMKLSDTYYNFNNFY